jgi:hypothetical protein
VVIREGLNLLLLAFGIGALVTALNGEARLPPVVLSLAIATGGLNVVVPLLVAKLERLAPEQFVVPGIVMIAAGALLVDSEALRRVLGL